ncbi:MAG: glycogen synthase GlgA [Christensenellales bacterium]|nr:glycogen synthase GlgA [Christensenellales bacterium]
MKILFAASECVPFIKTGGLADVVGALTPVLKAQGADVRVILPLYAAIPQEYVNQMKLECEFEVELCWRRQYCGIKSLEYQGVTFYFVDNQYYFGRSYIYGLGGDEYERFGFFDRAVIDALVHLDFKPDVVHCHDWQTGMIPALLKIQYAQYPFYQDMKTVYTIHNLQYQGVFPIKAVQDTLGLGDSLFTSDKLECYGCANYMKAGLVYADELTTVSPSYADEIQTAFYGERLDGLLRARKDQLVGILNGIDVNDYDPAKDPQIYANYDPYHLGGKEICKQELQKELGLEVDPTVPLVGIISRLSNQKGFDLIECVIRELMATGIQLVVLGMGEAKYTNLFSWAESEYPGRLATRFAMNHQLAHRIYAGSDMFLMPSQFEPCGLSQMIAMRYGSVPIARETGGLRDTVLSYNKFTDEGNGFTFFNYNAHDMLHTVRRAVHYYNNNRDVWYRLIVRGMTGDYSWYSSAGKYMALYEEVTKPATDFTLAQPAETENPKEAPAQSAPRAETEASAEVGETPKKAPAKRAPRKKAEAKAEEAPAKPKRAPRKKAEPKAEAKAEIKEEPKAEAKAEEAPAKPKRAPRKKAEPKTEVKTEVKEEPKAEEAPAKPKRAPRKKAAPKAEVTEAVKAEEKPAE